MRSLRELCITYFSETPENFLPFIKAGYNPSFLPNLIEELPENARMFLLLYLITNDMDVSRINEKQFFLLLQSHGSNFYDLVDSFTATVRRLLYHTVFKHIEILGVSKIIVFAKTYKWLSHLRHDENMYELPELINDTSDLTDVEWEKMLDINICGYPKHVDLSKLSKNQIELYKNLKIPALLLIDKKIRNAYIGTVSRHVRY